MIIIFYKMWKNLSFIISCDKTHFTFFWSSVLLDRAKLFLAKKDEGSLGFLVVAWLRIGSKFGTGSV